MMHPKSYIISQPGDKEDVEGEACERKEAGHINCFVPLTCKN